MEQGKLFRFDENRVGVIYAYVTSGKIVKLHPDNIKSLEWLKGCRCKGVSEDGYLVIKRDIQKEYSKFMIKGSFQ